MSIRNISSATASNICSPGASFFYGGPNAMLIKVNN
jgi:hypothetical protein